ncbi:ABC transporter ATP-binding protein [Thalassospira alkalitolerans]|uniref:Polyamine ABC transporter ATP-binding protein n=1 Tax=Thalassospira alkalitolerans TaxID=1293890 RepID=A0A1Y2L6A0_9PROT|nr:ATP-binding cassette domain-containing protein [Thalassospira alkalitolerans]OSQ42912.1 polyamine ABC transporter ATP-binding protein [Thalassospira alkalitolerans]|tara:strand:- start:30131 stop:30934 length:804 start_codon:yes stop_codon:yes gene_type:complete
MARQTQPIRLEVSDLTLAYGSNVIQRNVSFNVARGSIFAVMGGSGCGKSTLLKSLIGLLRPVTGSVQFAGENYWGVSAERRSEIGREFGVLFQSGGLWSSLSVAENVALPLRMFTSLNEASINMLVRLKLALVGLGPAADVMPADLSGGMRKRAGLARALALDPEILFFDEPSGGLDPITSKRLDDLILDLRDGLGATIILVSHELPSLLSIADAGIFLDADTRQPVAHGSPRELLETCDHPTVRAFMNRERMTTVENTGGHQDGRK